MKIENEYRGGEGGEGEKERKVLRWTRLRFIVDKMGFLPFQRYWDGEDR